jgi:hypothetical protein
VRVIAQGGDGGTTDIGFGCLSGMFERNDDVLYICYDNEAYMNTGVQRSSAPRRRRAHRHHDGGGPRAGATFGQGKKLPLIAMAHEIPYVATATVADLRDLEAKVERAMALHGARYLHVLVPCPLGWGAASHDTIRSRGWRARPASSRCSRPKRGEVTASPDPPPRAGGGVPEAAEALCAPVRPVMATRRCSRASRPRPTATSAASSCWTTKRREEDMTMDKPFAITLDPGSSLANKTGTWRTERPVYVDRLPPCNAQCPAGEDIQGWLFHAESGDYEAAWRHLTRDNPFPAIMGRVCYHSCEGACNRGRLDAAVGINSVERFLGDEALKRGWAFAAPEVETGKHVLIVGAGPSGMSAAYHLRRWATR